QMAALIPSLGSARFDSRGELRLAERLKDFLEENAYIWHNLPMGPRGRHPDFVIVHPSNGLLVLEVKDWRLDTIAGANKSDVELINDQMLAELNTQLGLTREKTAETRARLDRIEAVIRADSPDKQIAGTVSDTLNNPIIVKLRSQYLDLASREADWSNRFGKDHLAVVNLSRQIREIRASIADELSRIAETYRSDYEIAKQRQTEVEKRIAAAVSQFQQATQAQIELRQLESATEAYRGLYKAALQRNTELLQQQSFPGSEARLIARASTPTSKSSPKTLLVLLGATAGGMALGLGLSIVRASLDRVFRTSRQVEAALQATCLTLAPLLSPTKARSTQAPSGARTIVRNRNVIWEVVDRPLSRFAEGMRSIKLAADLRRAVKIVGITSSLPSEGKTTIGAAFALLAAQTGARTILVDCDLRHPALSAILAPSAEHGILDVISGKKPLEEVVWNEPTTNLSFLPGAGKSRVVHSSEILASPALRTLFGELREKYDYIIVDLPPVAPIVDVRSTSGLVDSYVFVVAWARTKIGVAELALSKAPEVHDSLLGVVLNKVNFKILSRHEGHYNDYYSNKLYAQYGIN
ncbi:MAG: AAA family ATPase, partial [Rhodospirillales bacterium]|nr:AAA family ATPase [Rhodospirillales bacterium]